MSARRWWPHRLAVLALLAVLWPALLAVLAPSVALGQAAGCSVIGADVTLADVSCRIDTAGLLSGTFTAPEVPASWSAGRSGECRRDADGQLCVFEIAVTACGRADPGRCASANFGLETRTRVTPVSPPPVIPVSPPPGSPLSPPPVQVRSEVIAANPLITLDPQAGGPGTPVTVTGSGFAAAGPPSATPPTTPPATTPAATAPASPAPSRTGQVVPVSRSSLAGPGIGLAVVLAVLAAVYVLLRRRSRGPGAGADPADAGPAAHVYARADNMRPRPVIRNTARGPARTMRIEVHRPAVAPHIEGRTPDDDSSSEPTVRITRIPLRPG
jgi:hypothetical protein